MRQAELLISHHMKPEVEKRESTHPFFSSKGVDQFLCLDVPQL